jgi:hypothetical protein
MSHQNQTQTNGIWGYVRYNPFKKQIQTLHDLIELSTLLLNRVTPRIQHEPSLHRRLRWSCVDCTASRSDVGWNYGDDPAVMCSKDLVHPATPVSQI